MRPAYLAHARSCKPNSMPEDFRLAKELKNSSQMINSLVFSGAILAAGGDDGKIRIYAVTQDGCFADLYCCQHLNSYMHAHNHTC